MADSTGVRTFESCSSVFEIPQEYKFKNMEDVQHYCDRALVLVNRANSPVVVRSAHANQSKAHYLSGGIYLPNRSTESWAWRELVVLHELAHHISQGDGHGQNFSGAMVYLVTEMVGAELGFLLRMEYLKEGVTLREFQYS